MDKKTLNKLKRWLKRKIEDSKKKAIRSMVGFSTSDRTISYKGKREAFEEMYEKLNQLSTN